MGTKNGEKAKREKCESDDTKRVKMSLCEEEEGRKEGERLCMQRGGGGWLRGLAEGVCPTLPS